MRGLCGGPLSCVSGVLQKVTLRSQRPTILCLGRNWQNTRFMEVEVAVRLLYMLAEALPVSHGAHFSGDVSKASALQDMMRTVGIHRTFPGNVFVLCAVLCCKLTGILMGRARCDFTEGLLDAAVSKNRFLHFPSSW